jgi:hypothetical protein
MMVLLQRQKSSFNVCHLSKSVCIFVLMMSCIAPSSTHHAVFYDFALPSCIRLLSTITRITPSSTISPHRQEAAPEEGTWLLLLVASWHVDRAWLRSLVHTSCGPCHSGPKGGILPWSSIADLSPFSEQHHIMPSSMISRITPSSTILHRAIYNFALQSTTLHCLSMVCHCLHCCLF